MPEKTGIANFRSWKIALLAEKNMAVNSNS
jgi:hypothetical protein